MSSGRAGPRIPPSWDRITCRRCARAPRSSPGRSTWTPGPRHVTRWTRSPRPEPPCPDYPASAAPAGLATQPCGEALVVRAEMLRELGTQRVGHGGPGASVLGGEGGSAMVGQAQEIEGPVIARAGVGEEVSAVHHVDPVPAEDARQAVELFGVVAAAAVGVVVEGEALVAGFGGNALGFTVQAGVFEFQRP